MIRYRTGQYVDAQTAAKLIGCSERHIRRCCSEGEFAGARREGQRWFVPVTAHPKLIAGGSASTAADLAEVSAPKRDEALRRLGIINDCERFCGTCLQTGGIGRREAIQIFAAQNKIAWQTLYRWMGDFRRDGIKGLVDLRGGVTDFSNFTKEAQEFFRSIYLTEQRLSVRVCHSMTVFKSKSENLEWDVPSLRTLHNWIEQNIPEPVRVLLREGKAAYDAKCAPFIQVDPDSIEPGQWWTGDHHQFNCWVRHRGAWVRPWVTAWEDMRTRTLVGWQINAGPNQSTILIAMRRAIEQYGPPEAVKIDNGKDYDSQMWTGVTKLQRRRCQAKGELDEQLIAGVYGMMGITVSFAIPYHPQAKPIERLFDTADQQFTKTFATYCGKDNKRKPEDLTEYLKTQKAIDEGYTLEEFGELFSRWADAYNNSAHTGAGMEGRTPLEVMATRKSRRAVDSEALELLMQVWSGEVKVGKNGVRFKGLLYGQFDPRLTEQHFGKLVKLAYNPDDIRSVAVYDAKSLRLLCIAEQNHLAKYGDPVSEEFTREAMAKKSAARRAAKAYHSTRHAAHLDLTELTIAAKNDAAREAAAEHAEILRPVPTPLDGQGRQYKREAAQRRLKKAAGAESMSLGLGDLIQNEKREITRLGLFDE